TATSTVAGEEEEWLGKVMAKTKQKRTRGRTIHQVRPLADKDGYFSPTADAAHTRNSTSEGGL
ncbi:hypothetical protein, partial [Comamonas sp. B-9]|uniref:hypothetical protein n=1 Tax=Comamonas sp. B-9 TaxID=1055192 RepID=UPI00195541E6